MEITFSIRSLYHNPVRITFLPRVRPLYVLAHLCFRSNPSQFGFLKIENQKKNSQKTSASDNNHVDQSEPRHEKINNEVWIVPDNPRISQEMFEEDISKTLRTLGQRFRTEQTLDYTSISRGHGRTPVTFILDTWRRCNTLDRSSDR